MRFPRADKRGTVPITSDICSVMPWLSLVLIHVGGGLPAMGLMHSSHLPNAKHRIASKLPPTMVDGFYCVTSTTAIPAALFSFRSLSQPFT
jgi:hypothetical protein